MGEIPQARTEAKSQHGAKGEDMIGRPAGFIAPPLTPVQTPALAPVPSQKISLFPQGGPHRRRRDEQMARLEPYFPKSHGKPRFPQSLGGDCESAIQDKRHPAGGGSSLGGANEPINLAAEVLERRLIAPENQCEAVRRMLEIVLRPL